MGGVGAWGASGILPLAFHSCDRHNLSLVLFDPPSISPQTSLLMPGSTTKAVMVPSTERRRGGCGRRTAFRVATGFAVAGMSKFLVLGAAMMAWRVITVPSTTAQKES